MHLGNFEVIGGITNSSVKYLSVKFEANNRLNLGHKQDNEFYFFIGPSKTQTSTCFLSYFNPCSFEFEILYCPQGAKSFAAVNKISHDRNTHKNTEREKKPTPQKNHIYKFTSVTIHPSSTIHLESFKSLIAKKIKDLMLNIAL